LSDELERAIISPPQGTDGPVTTTVTRRVKPGHETFYEQFLVGISAAASHFPGHLGVDIFRPESASTGEYRVVYRFDSALHLRAWLDSGERASWLERAEPHVIGPMRTRFVTGLETWFTLPDRPAARPPPPYKMALLTWITIFPLITLVVLALEPLLTELALIPRLGVTTAVTVPIMTWLVMPRMTRLLRSWLYPDPPARGAGRSPAKGVTPT
jgi:antibiotic biosynthesis monooxygenase (ABM) superfamily enzyme